jgi:heme-degrading monooxygenase HmoA
MWIRLGSFSVQPGQLEQLGMVYNLECVPIVKATAGNIDCYLMENVDEPSRCIVCTAWRTEQDAKAYEASGAAMNVVAKVRAFFAGPPSLASYRVADRE